MEFLPHMPMAMRYSSPTAKLSNSCLKVQSQDKWFEQARKMKADAQQMYDARKLETRAAALNRDPHAFTNMSIQFKPRRDEMPMRGGWPATGGYSMNATGKGGWWVDQAPPRMPPGAGKSPKYAWQQRQFVRAVA